MGQRKAIALDGLWNRASSEGRDRQSPQQSPKGGRLAMKPKRVIDCGGVANYVEPKPSHTPTIEWNVDPFKDKNGIHDGNVQLWADMPEADAAYVCRAVLVHEALVNTVKTLLSELRWTSQNGEFPGMEYVFKSAEKALAQASGE